MRRALVLGDETANHPFLKQLPPHVRRPQSLRNLRHTAPEPLAQQAMRTVRQAGEEIGSAMERGSHAFVSMLRRGPVHPGPITGSDVRGFLLAYCACFLAVVAFIA